MYPEPLQNPFIEQGPGLVPPMKLFGTERGKIIPIQPLREGVYLLEADGSLRQVPASMRLIGEQKKRLHGTYARQYLEKKNQGGTFSQAELLWELFLLNLHEMLVEPHSDGVPKPVFPIPLTLSNQGVVNIAAMEMLPLRALADGEMQRLSDEYALFMKTQLPPYPSQEQRSQILEEGKNCALSILHSRHGSLALIQVLHGLGAGPFPQ